MSLSEQMAQLGRQAKHAARALAQLRTNEKNGCLLAMANALEPLRSARDVTLNGESAIVAGEASAGGVLSGFQILNLHVESGCGLD